MTKGCDGKPTSDKEKRQDPSSQKEMIKMVKVDDASTENTNNKPLKVLDEWNRFKQSIAVLSREEKKELFGILLGDDHKILKPLLEDPIQFDFVQWRMLNREQAGLAFGEFYRKWADEQAAQWSENKTKFVKDFTNKFHSPLVPLEITPVTVSNFANKFQGGAKTAQYFMTYREAFIWTSTYIITPDLITYKERINRLQLCISKGNDSSSLNTSSNSFYPYFYTKLTHNSWQEWKGTSQSSILKDSDFPSWITTHPVFKTSGGIKEQAIIDDLSPSTPLTIYVMLCQDETNTPYEKLAYVGKANTCIDRWSQHGTYIKYAFLKQFNYNIELCDMFLGYLINKYGLEGMRERAKVFIIQKTENDIQQLEAESSFRSFHKLTQMVNGLNKKS